jgi:hypothetical protein
MIRAAYLRVFIPSSQVAGLPPHRPDRSADRITQSDAFLFQESTEDDAFYTVWQGSQYVCPRNARLRMLEGMLAFTSTHPELRLVSDRERRAYSGELAELRRSSRHARRYILSSAWHVPLRWFAAFHRSERELYESEGRTSLRYRTSLGEAIDRVRWAVGVLETAGFNPQVIERVADLEEWLSEFSADSMVELDYASVADGFSSGDLAFDESADDVRESLLALERGDVGASGDAYERVAMRWADAQSYTFSN